MNIRLRQFDQHGIKYGFVGKVGTPPAFDRPNQVHGTEIIVADPRTTGPAAAARSDGDGILTQARAYPVGVLTADCLPVLLADQRKTMAMAVHAGWRGLAAGIMRAALLMFRDGSITPSEILVGIGPAISGANYEVGIDVINAMSGPDCGLSKSQIMSCYNPGRRDHYQLSIAKIAELVLTNAGVPAKNIQIVDSCTFANPNLWHSYRRDKPNVGRNHSWISL